MRDRIVRKRLLLYVHSESLLSVQCSAIGKLVQVMETHCLGKTILGHLSWMGWETHVSLEMQLLNMVSSVSLPVWSLTINHSDESLPTRVWRAPSSEDRTLGPRKPLIPGSPSPLPCTFPRVFQLSPLFTSQDHFQNSRKKLNHPSETKLSILWTENLHTTTGRDRWSLGGPGRENLKENKPSK